VGQVGNLRRIVNPPAAGLHEPPGMFLSVGRRIANPRQIANLPTISKGDCHNGWCCQPFPETI